MAGYSQTYEKLNAKFTLIKDARLRFRGSKEFDEADESFEKVTKAFERIKNKGAGYKPTAGELEYIQKTLDDGIEKADAYLDTKKDIDEVDMGYNTVARVNSMEMAKEILTSVSADIEKELTEHREKAANENEAPSAEQISRDMEGLKLEFDEARENVHFGSKAYDKAVEGFERLDAEWKTIKERYKDGGTPNPYELQNLKAKIAEAQKLNGDYRVEKDDKDLEKNPKTAKRLAAMERASEYMDAQLKTIEKWEKEYANTLDSKEYTNAEMSAKAESSYAMMERWDRKTTKSSAEFKRAKEIAKELKEEWKRIEAKGEDYKLSPAEVDKISKLNNELNENVDKYIRNKAEKEKLSGYEQTRLDMMGSLKNDAATTKSVMDRRKKAIEAESANLTDNQIAQDARSQSRDLKMKQHRVGRSRVWFGSKQYKNALADYNKSVLSWEKITKDKPEDYKPTEEELQKSKDDLEKTKESIQKYLDRNKDKDLSKHPKTKARMEAMQKAYENVDKRLNRVNKALDAKKELDGKEKEKEIIERNKQRKEELKNAKGVDKHVGKGVLAAEERLGRLSQRKEFTAKDLKDAKMAMAAQILEARLKAPGGEKFKEQIPPTKDGYAKAIKQIANSKAFKQAMPDSKITPETCKKMIKDPKAADSLMWNFNTKLIENKKIKEAIVKQQEKKKEVEKPNLQTQQPAK